MYKKLTIANVGKKVELEELSLFTDLKVVSYFGKEFYSFLQC